MSLQNLWRQDGHRWLNGGVTSLPKKNPIVKKTYFYIAKKRKESDKGFQKTVYRLQKCSRIFYGHITSNSLYSTSQHDSNNQTKIDLSEFPSEKIRNFSIVAHVDHGKSTLADRLLECTGTISKEVKNEQVLDKLQVERERGITVKAQTASLVYVYKGSKYLLNLIDTPGHVDFSYEVSRSLAACEGVILLVDANEGVQAQTVANFYLAFEQELVIIPALNKIDLKVAKPEEVQQQIQTMFDFQSDEILKISAKRGIGIEMVLQAIIERIPPPNSNIEKSTKVLLFDSWFDKYRGAICNILIKDGVLSKGDKIRSAHSQKKYDVHELGILYPNEYETNVLYAGQVGYLVAHMKSSQEAQIGDTLHLDNAPVDKLPGFKPAKPMVFAGFFPTDQSEYHVLSKAMEKLTLNDSSVSVSPDSSAALGQGWRLGFLGLLHLDVFSQRLEQEYNASVIITSPNVPYKVKITGKQNVKVYGGEELSVLNPYHMPDEQIITNFYEPMVLSTIIAPDEYMTPIIKLILERRGDVKDQSYIDNKRLIFKVVFPLNEIVVDFFDNLKSLTSGYASFDYEDYGYQETLLKKIDIVLNGKIVEEMTVIAHVSKARQVGKFIVAKLKEAIPQQLYLIAIQAKCGTKVLAREDIKPLRKDVLAKCYGGDITRKEKLLRRQAEGKKKMRKIGNIDVPKDAFISILKR